MRVSVGDGSATRARGLPTELSIAAGFGAVIAGCLVTTWVFPPGAAGGRLVVLSAVLVVFSVVVDNVTAAVVTAGLAWPFYLGFLVDRHGELHWHGDVDLLRLTVLVMASLMGTALGRLVISGRFARAPKWIEE